MEKMRPEETDVLRYVIESWGGGITPPTILYRELSEAESVEHSRFGATTPSKVRAIIPHESPPASLGMEYGDEMAEKEVWSYREWVTTYYEYREPDNTLTFHGYYRQHHFVLWKLKPERAEE